MRKNYNASLEKEIIQRRRRGMTIRQIADDLGGLSTSHVHHYLKKYSFEKQTIYIPRKIVLDK